MATVRAYQASDGSVRVVHPNSRQKEEDETEEKFLTRIFADAEDRDPTLKGLPFVEIDTTDLPPREQSCVECGGTHSVRDQWRISGERVAVDTTLINQARDKAHAIRDDGALILEEAKTSPVIAAVARQLGLSN